MATKVWSLYLVARLIIGAVDVLTDVAHTGHLLGGGHGYAGLATGVWVVIGWGVAVGAVLTGRCRTGDPMPCGKYALLAMVIHADIVGAFVESGPELVVQMVLVWSGVNKYDAQALLGPPSWPWFWAWFQLLCLFSSLLSLMLTGVKVNREPKPIGRQIWGFTSSFTTALYRIFIYSVMFTFAPMISGASLLLLYLTSCCLHRCWGDGVALLRHAYFSLFLPVGHAHNLTVRSKLSGIGISESERSKINQDALAKRTFKFYSLHLCQSMLLLAPYFSILEVWHLPDPTILSSISLMSSRYFIYITPLSLLLLSFISCLLYSREVAKVRDGVATWSFLKSPIPVSSVTGNTETSDNTRASSKASSTARNSVYSNNATAPRDTTSPTNPYPTNPYPTNPYLSPSAPAAPSPSSHSLISASRPHPPGTRKCEHEDCVTCAWIVEGTGFKSTVTGKTFRFMPSVTCSEKNVIYLVTCGRCFLQYVGKTEQELRKRHYGHRREVEQGSTLLGKHFGEGCGYNKWRIQIIDKCPPSQLGKREGHWMHELGTIMPGGLNVRDELSQNNLDKK